MLTTIMYGRRYEKVPVSSGGDGLWHQVNRQEKGNSCGPTCVRMACEMVTGRQYGEEYFRGLATLAEMGVSASDLSPLSQSVSTSHDYETTPSYTAAEMSMPEAMVLKAMKDAKVPARKADQGSNFLEHWQQSSVKAPAIAGFFWRDTSAGGYQYSGAGGHYVVIAGPMKNQPGKFLVLDPAMGVQAVHVKSYGFYYPRQGGSTNGKLLGEGKLDRDDVYLTY